MPAAQNLFRIGGDVAHLLSFVVLLLRLRVHKNAAGLSLKTQELFLLAFVARYLDLFVSFGSVYNTIMKVIYIGCSALIVYMLRCLEPWKTTYDRSQDSFLHIKFAVAPCAVLALLIHQEFSVLEVLWTFSIYLEAVAIVPQLIVLARTQDVENLTSNYVFLLGLYRALYLFNWIYRAATEMYYHHQWIVWISGLVQTALYVDFFYYYALSKYHNTKFNSKFINSKPTRHDSQ